jgi:hypothetical protein
VRDSLSEEHRHTAVPWRVGELVSLYCFNLAGLVLILLAWFQVSGQVDLGSQMRWLNAGVAGVIVAGAGNVLWLMAGRRRVGELCRSAARPVLARAARNRTVANAPTPDGAVGQLVSGQGMTRFHRRSCLFVAGKPVTPASERGHIAAGRRPCDACLASGAGQ